MWTKLFSCMLLVLFPVAMVVAQDDSKGAAGPNPKVATAVTQGPAGNEAKTVTAATGSSGGQATQPATAVTGSSDGQATPPATVSSAASGDPDTAKMVGGMSILGNKEAPMSLFIVPWKTSELGAETNLTRTLNERRAPVDRDVFLREIAFYQVSASIKSLAPTAPPQLLTSR